MDWQQRLREMIVAGGALTSVACSSGGAVQSAVAPADVTDASSKSVAPDSGNPEDGAPPEMQPPDASLPDASVTPPDASQPDTSVTPGLSCCNANSDPCCPVLYCGQPMNPECACELDGGTSSSIPSSVFVCLLPKDGGVGDADAGDANAVIDHRIDPNDGGVGNDAEVDAAN